MSQSQAVVCDSTSSMYSRSGCFLLMQNFRNIFSPFSTVVEAEGQNYGGFKGSLTGLRLLWNQFFGLIVKRFIYTKRRYLLFGILGFVPMILAILTMTLANGKSNTTEFEPITLTRETYANKFTEYFYNNMTNVTNNIRFIDAYTDVAVGYGGAPVQEKNFTKFLLDKGMFLLPILEDILSLAC